MDLDHPRWGIIGVAFTVITFIATYVASLIVITDPSTRFLVSIGLPITIVVLFFVYWKLRAGKRITYEVISDTLVITVDEEVRGKVEILFNKVPVEDARLVVVHIRNAGSTIPSSDYESPFTLNFGDHAEILEATVLQTNPEEIKDKILLRVSANKVVFDPLLLNSRDTITLKILTSKSQPEIKLEARIKGLNRAISIDEINEERLILLTKAKKVILPFNIFFGAILFLITIIVSILQQGGATSQAAYNRIQMEYPFFSLTVITSFLLFALLGLSFGLVSSSLNQLKELDEKKHNPPKKDTAKRTRKP